MKLIELKKDAAARLGALYDAGEAASIFYALIQSRLDMPRCKVLAEPDMEIAPDTAPGLEAALTQLENGMPLQYVLGFQEFCGHRIKVAPGCLIPRPETEEMVQMIIGSLEGRELEGEGEFNILDMCTGSGCIAWSLAAAFPQAQVFACDSSDDALRIACRQRIRLHGAKPVFFKADVLLDPPAGLPEFNLIVSNPPYIAESEKGSMHRNVLEYEPPEALFVPDNDVLRFYGAVSRWASSHLAPGGEIWCEINERYGSSTASVFGAGTEILKDINGKDRFVHFSNS